MPVWAKFGRFWAKFGRFWAQNPIFWAQGVKILVPSYQDSNETLFRLENNDRWGSNWPLGAQMCFFWPQNLDIWGQKSIFLFSDRNFLLMEQMTTIPGATTFPSEPPPKKISFSELGVIFWGSPLFLAIFGHWRIRGATTLNFWSDFNETRGESSGVIKKMTQKDNRPGPGRNHGETGVFTFGRKVVFGLKMGLTPKNHPKWHFPPWWFGQRQLFSLNNFFRSWPEHG